MRRAPFALALSLLLTGASASAQTRLPVALEGLPDEPGIRYEAVSLERTPDGLLVVVTRRIGPRAETFAKRELDCQGGRARHLGSGHTLDEMNAARPDHRHILIDPASITGHIAAWACAQT